MARGDRLLGQDPPPPPAPCPTGNSGEPSKEGNTAFSLSLLPTPGLGGDTGPEGIPGGGFWWGGCCSWRGGGEGPGDAGRQRPVCIYEEDLWEGPGAPALAAVAVGLVGDIGNLRSRWTEYCGSQQEQATLPGHQLCASRPQMGPGAQESSLGFLNQAPAIPAPVCLHIPWAKPSLPGPCPYSLSPPLWQTLPLNSIQDIDCALSPQQSPVLAPYDGPNCAPRFMS